MNYFERESEAKALIAKYGKSWMLYDDEAIGEVMNTAYLARIKHDPTKSKLSTYLIRSVKNKIWRLSKLRYRNQLLEISDGCSLNNKHYHLRDFIENCRILSDKEKIVLIKYYFEFTKMKEIGKELGGLSKQRIKQYLQKGISKLKEIKHVLVEK